MMFIILVISQHCKRSVNAIDSKIQLISPKPLQHSREPRLALCTLPSPLDE